MNERIRELAEQAKKYALDAMIKITDKEQALKAYSETYDTKFAELIVEECRYVMDCNKGSDQHTEWNRALFETSEKIKEHFGVEE